MRKSITVHLCRSCDAILLTKRQFCNEVCKQVDLCKSIGTTNYLNRFVVTTFQEMIRAESGAAPEGYYPAIRRNVIAPIYKCVGECVCVTCGEVYQWEGTGELHCGHYCSRKDRSVLFEEDNCATQCAGCNHPPGKHAELRKWMLEMRGIEVVERLENLKHEKRQYLRPELVGMRIEFRKRLKAAVKAMKG